jgi:hypothetical protein
MNNEIDILNVLLDATYTALELGQKKDEEVGNEKNESDSK